MFDKTAPLAVGLFRRSACLAIVLGISTLSAPVIASAAPALAKPDPAIANIPVTQFQAQSAPVMPAPLAGHTAVGAVFAIQSYSSSQQTPTSAAPGPQACVNNGTCSQITGCVNAATWPSVSQSIAWWQGQNQNLKGTYAWNVGSTYSHQDAEGWISNCVYKPQPSCPTGAGWSGSYSWAYPNWISHCTHQAPPSCAARGVGWSGYYSWNGSGWVAHCSYTPPQQPYVLTYYHWGGGHAGSNGIVPRQIQISQSQFQCAIHAVYSMRYGCGRRYCYASFNLARQTGTYTAQQNNPGYGDVSFVNNEATALFNDCGL